MHVTNWPIKHPERCRQQQLADTRCLESPASRAGSLGDGKWSNIAECCTAQRQLMARPGIRDALPCCWSSACHPLLTKHPAAARAEWTQADRKNRLCIVPDAVGVREICISKSAWAFGIFSTWKPLCCKFQVLNFRCKFQCLFFKWSSFSWVPVGYGQFSWGVFLHVLLFFFPVTSLIFFTVLSCSHLHIFTLRLVVVLVFCLRVTYHTWFFSYQALHVEFIEVFL